MLSILGLVLGVVLTATAGPAVATGDAPRPGPSGIGGNASADSLRTNLWLVEALMGEIVAEAAASLPPPPATVLLPGAPAPNDHQAQLLRLVAVRVLEGRGYELLTGAEAAMRDRAAVTATFTPNLVELGYPEVGRTLGLWRRWVGREVFVAATVRIVENESGRLLLERRLERAFSDRVPDGDFALVNDRLYPFTSAAISESGWQRRLEQFAVLGTLAGLVAVYFANTGD